MWGTQTPGHWFDSYAASIHDDKAAQSFTDIDIICKVISQMYNIQFNIDNNMAGSSSFHLNFGDHYRLLAALTKVLESKTIVEIGTSRGGSARALLEFSPIDAKVFTFDIIPWNEFDFAGGTWLKDTDFSSGNLTQYLGDLSKEDMFLKHADLLSNADVIFCDAPKDGVFEYQFLENLQNLKMPFKRRFLVLDDIKFMNMAALWRQIASPKIDLTSFGHWSGTGLVAIHNGLELFK